MVHLHLCEVNISIQNTHVYIDNIREYTIRYTEILTDISLKKIIITLRFLRTRIRTQYNV